MLVTINGIFRPFALVDGRAVATWRYAAGKVTIEPLGKVTQEGDRGAGGGRGARSSASSPAASGRARVGCGTVDPASGSDDVRQGCRRTPRSVIEVSPFSVS